MTNRLPFRDPSPRGLGEGELVADPDPAPDERTPTERYHSTHFHGEMEVTGTFSMSGPQPVGPNGVPDYVAEIFRANDHIRLIAIEFSREGRPHSVVYQRMENK